MPEDKRVDDLREDLQELRKEMHIGFESLERRLTESSSQLARDNKSRIIDKDKDIDEIRCLLKEHEGKINRIDDKHNKKYNELYNLFVSKFNQLDKKLLNLFLIGNVIGMGVGSVITLILQTVIRNM